MAQHMIQTSDMNDEIMFHRIERIMRNSRLMSATIKAAESKPEKRKK